VKIAFLSPALREILEAIEYYEGQATGLGGALDADLRRTLDLIVENPSLGSPYERGTRRALLRRFPYMVIYRPLDDRILVVAFAHGKRRPAYWTDRV
jgi:plasmid stabilization system protein ParE